MDRGISFIFYNLYKNALPVRDQVRKHGEAFVIAGTAYHQQMPQLPGADERHTAPSGFWKVITVKGRTEACFFEQSAQPGMDFGRGKIDLLELARLTRLDFPQNEG